MDELKRIRDEYGRRDEDPRYGKWYSRFDPADLFIRQEREREVLRFLGQRVGAGLPSCRVLDVGCGHGHELVKFVGLGTDAHRLFGLDLLLPRIQTAKSKYSNLQFACGDAGALPYADRTFDLVLQFTLFSSVLSHELRTRISHEMLRVLRPRGFILWYDFRLNPRNAQTRGIGKGEIKSLFPNCAFLFQSVTLVPLLARWLAPRSWLGCTMLSQLPFLRTHNLGLIWRKDYETPL